jgi:hypothetical protein
MRRIVIDGGVHYYYFTGVNALLQEFTGVNALLQTII